ncbi:MAG: hypothetical protein HZC37_18495 [Burkholderiales bacterium]|nr:hypothetical protein [Burkholderiales bacterium]
MTWIEWGVLAAGLAVGYGVVSMLMGERHARARRAPPDAAAAAPAPKAGDGERPD